ncbi:GNAT family N-acetyltransferase [Kitasatospora sp. NPDC006697]|uniref:GNAT family N-acetyltransferase n=1 Tax=Kitasatospora sp. NPDC006697 TaxID=3364020 RepID=UPI00368E6B29
MPQLTSLHDRAGLAARFRTAPALHLFELGDLDDLLWPHTSWYTLADRGPVALLYAVGELPTVLLSAPGPHAPGVAELLRAMLPVLPRRFLAHLPERAADALAPDYRVAHRVPMLRMALTSLSGATGDWHPAPLGPGDLADLLALFAEAYPGNWFDERMLATGHYVGIRQDGRLIATAGIHAHSADQRVAALGNVTTLPALRGQGAAAACVTALCRRLAASTDTIGLNVRADNPGAIDLYRRLGFRTLTAFEELVLDGSSG